jgi:hypothetical protein
MAQEWVSRSLTRVVALLLSLVGVLLLVTERGYLPRSSLTSSVEGGGCSDDTDCSLNGKCIFHHERRTVFSRAASPFFANKVQGKCSCKSQWTGDYCQLLNTEGLPATAAYGYYPNVTSWGASIIKVENTFHMFVAQQVGAVGMAGWAAHSRIVRATSATLQGPYEYQSQVYPVDKKKDLSISNPQIVYDKYNDMFVLVYIHGSGDFKVMSSSHVEGPWKSWGRVTGLSGGCNNPSPAIHRNGTIFLACHNNKGSLYSIHRSKGLGWTGDFDPTPIVALPRGEQFGNCEDPVLYFDEEDNFHIIGHCYTCYWYPGEIPGRGVCTGTCSAHGASRSGKAGTWTWRGNVNAPYSFVAAANLTAGKEERVVRLSRVTRSSLSCLSCFGLVWFGLVWYLVNTCSAWV